MSFAFVSVSVTHNFESLNSAIDVFDNDSFPRKLTVKVLFFLRQWFVFALFIRGLTVRVKLNYSLITAIRQKLNQLVNPNEFVLEKCEIMRFPHCLSYANDFQSFAVYDELRFDCMSLFLA